MSASTYSEIVNEGKKTWGPQKFYIAAELDPVQFQELVEKCENSSMISLIEYDSDLPLRSITVQRRES